MRLIYFVTASLASLSISKPDRAKTMASQLASKGYFAGEAVGFRFGRSSGLYNPDHIAVLMTDGSSQVKMVSLTRRILFRSERSRCSSRGLPKR